MTNDVRGEGITLDLVSAAEMTKLYIDRAVDDIFRDEDYRWVGEATKKVLHENILDVTEAFFIDSINGWQHYVDDTDVFLSKLIELFNKHSVTIKDKDYRLIEFMALPAEDTEEITIQFVENTFLSTLDPLNLHLRDIITKTNGVEELHNQEIYVHRLRNLMVVVFEGDFRINWFNNNYGKTKNDKE